MQPSLFPDDQHDPGSKPLPLPRGVVAEAVYGGERKEYRYLLSHIWDPTKPALAWLMMNPSVASEHSDDRTVARTRSFSALWGYGGVLIVNTMAYRATDQGRLTHVTDPVGPDNMKNILKACKSGFLIAAYGTPRDKKLMDFGPECISEIRKTSPQTQILCLELSKTGRPKHPLYISSDTKPFPFP